MLLLVAKAKMSYFDTEKGLLDFSIVSVPVSVATILINVFFICCMFFSREGPENLQMQPLNVLLGSLIGCNLVLNIFNIFYVLYDTFHMPEWIYTVFFVAMLYALRTSLTDSLGLNVFYYFQIVPTNQPFLIWVKTHIKCFIYLMLFFDKIFILFEFIVRFLPGTCLIPDEDLNSSSESFTEYQVTGVCYYPIMTDIWFRCVYFLVGLGVMVASNTSTVLYLRKHLKRMENSSSFFALHYQKQKRVTILSIIQTLLFFIYSVGLITFELNFVFKILLIDVSVHILCFALTFYSFGTTIILSLGQTKFRFCAVEIWKKLGQAISERNLNVGDRNGHFNCCFNFCYSKTENG